MSNRDFKGERNQGEGVGVGVEGRGVEKDNTLKKYNKLVIMHFMFFIPL